MHIQLTCSSCRAEEPCHESPEHRLGGNGIRNPPRMWPWPLHRWLGLIGLIDYENKRWKAKWTKRKQTSQKKKRKKWGANSTAQLAQCATRDKATYILRMRRAARDLRVWPCRRTSAVGAGGATGDTSTTFNPLNYRMRLNFRGTKLLRFSRSGTPSANRLIASISNKCCEIVKMDAEVPLAPLSPLYWIGSRNTDDASLDIN